MTDELFYESDEVDAVEDSLIPMDETVSFVKERFTRAKDKKFVDEQRFLLAYRNYRGLYGSDLQFSENEKSRVFVKVTKTKVVAAYGQIVEVLFGNGDFPISVDQTKLPEGVVDSVSFTPDIPEGGQKAAPTPNTNPVMKSPFGTNTGPSLPAGATAFNLGALKEKLSPITDKLVAGPGTTPTSVTFHPAHIAAKKMEKKIQDQLEESGASKHLRSSAFECALFGTGILKGPMALDKEYPNWDEKGKYEPVTKVVPTLSHVSIWNFYPDPDAANMDQAEYIVERHKLSKRDMKDLKRRPFFRPSAIDNAIDGGASYQREYWESIMEDDAGGSDVERWEVLEYWGYVEAKLLREKNVPVPKEHKDEDMINANIWVCNNEVLRLVMNPFQPSRIPYYAAPYEMNPYSFFGIGVAENMEDTQILMNGFMRMAVDNAALSGNLVFEIDETNLVPGQDLSIYPGKVFRRQAGAPGQAFFGTQFPNVAQQNLMLFDKARVLADESTGLPSYSYGQTGIQGVGRTASGISMLMNAANGSIRTVVKNLDDYLLAPLGKAFFAFNMQFDFDPEIKGDLEVSARGTESLMANEVRSQRLMQFLGIVSNPILAPFAKLDVVIREIAKSLDLDEDKVTNSLADAAVQAELLKGMMPPTGPQGAAGAPAGVQATDTTGSGGGNVGTGSVPAPGTAGFSANTSG
jgi:hypothetical protein